MSNKTDFWDRYGNPRARTKKKYTKPQGSREHLKVESSFPPEATLIGTVAAIRNKNFIVMNNDNYTKCSLSDFIYLQTIGQLVVGDRVHFIKTTQDQGYIVKKEDRQTIIARMRGDSTRYAPVALQQHVLVANLDIAVIVASSKNPEFHPRFIDRYLMILQNGNVKPVICISKSELTTERHPIIDFYKASGIPVIETSVVNDMGIDTLKNLLRGSISALVGNSGVGKSSLANSIIPAVNLEVSEVSQRTGKGRHTTTATSLYRWDNDSYIIDTPGIRSLGIEDIVKADIRFFFPEFENFSKYCKYKNCLHDHEPGCGVKNAVELGEINIYRYQSYQRMLQE